MDFSVVANHVTPDTVAAVVLWLLSEILGATKRTRATGVVHGLGILAEKAIQRLPFNRSMDNATIQAEIERQVEAKVEQILNAKGYVTALTDECHHIYKPLQEIAASPSSAGPPQSDSTKVST